MLAFSLIFLISVFSIFKVPVSDLKIYLYYFNTLEGASFDELLESTYLSIKEYEYFFKFYTWTIKNIFYQNWFYVFLNVFIIYHAIIKLTIKYVLNVLDCPISRLNIFIILLWCILVAITFSTTTHLIRQYLAIAIFSYACVALINKSYLLCFVLVAFSVMTHYSMLIILFVSSISLVFRPLFLKFKFSLSLVIISASFILSIIFENVGVIKSLLATLNYSGGGDLSVSPLLIIFDLLIFSLFFCLYRRSKSKQLKMLLFLVVVYVGFLITIHNYNYIFLRFYFIFDVIRSILGTLIILKINFTPRLVFIPASVLLFFTYFLLRFYMSPWSYGVSHIGV
jgi:hypothetical protein